ncbi:hypothetical protein COO60DRAFT_1468676, partial [Scenedesmus sp. NREL 46B-D3]
LTRNSLLVDDAAHSLQGLSSTPEQLGANAAATATEFETFEDLLALSTTGSSGQLQHEVNSATTPAQQLHCRGTPATQQPSCGQAAAKVKLGSDAAAAKSLVADDVAAAVGAATSAHLSENSGL